MPTNKNLKFLVIFFIVLLIILSHFVGILLPVENFFRGIIKPGTKIIYNWSLELETPETFTKVADLENAYIELKNKYNQRAVDFTKFELLQKENEQLRALLDLAGQAEWDMVVAGVIGKSVDNLRNAIIINQGQRDGLKPGATVVAGAGFYIGKISKVEESISIVQLLNDQNSKLAATIVGRDKSIGLIEGGYGLTMQMNLIPQNEAVAVGDIVITSGLETGVPYGLLVGEVNVVEKEAYQPFQKAIVLPYLELEKLQVVSVITDFNI